MMVLEKCNLLFSIFIDLFVSLCTLPFLILKLNRTISASCKIKSRKQHQHDITEIANELRLASNHNPRVQIAIFRKPGEGHSSRSTIYKKGKYQVNISALDSIIEINQKEKYAEVEALVTFEQLCKATLKHGLLPAVVPEFKTITIGGAIQGIGIESTSWMFGTFDKTIIEATLITGRGTILSSSEAPDLWKALPGSNGTLALIVAARVRLIEATDWIHLRYVYYSDSSKFFHAVKEQHTMKTRNTGWLGNNQVIDAINFCRRDQNIKNGIVAMYGGCVRQLALNLPIYGETIFSPFFYQHVNMIFDAKHQDIDSDGIILHEEYIPTLEYLFRYDKGGFWGIETITSMIPILKLVLYTPILRAVLNHFFKTSTLYKIAMLVSDQRRESIGMLQDVDVPIEHAHEIINWAMRKDLAMLWLCPVLSCRHDEGLFSVATNSKTSLIMNIGLYGSAKDLPQSNFELQRLVAKLDGKTALYAHIYANRDEFWSWYNYEEYTRLRQKWDGNVFMDLWDKVGGALLNPIREST